MNEYLSESCLALTAGLLKASATTLTSFVMAGCELGSAAITSSTAYATAEQGAAADTALAALVDLAAALDIINGV